VLCEAIKTPGLYQVTASLLKAAGIEGSENTPGTRLNIVRVAMKAEAEGRAPAHQRIVES